MVLGLILLNGVFSGAEIAILSLRKTRVQELVERGSTGARWVAALRADPERFLATVQVGITVIGATAAAFGGASVAARLAPVVAAVPLMGPYADDLALAIVVAGVSFLSLVLGELVPKSLALHAGERYALLVSRPLAALSWVARPLVGVLTGASNLVLRLFGDRTSFSESRLSAEELRHLMDEAATAGTVDADAGEIAARAIEFSGLDVGSLLVPRSQMVSVPSTITLDELADLALRVGHSRVLVHGSGTDDVLGLLNVRDALARGRTQGVQTIEQMLHPVPFVPVTMLATSLLRELQQQRTHLAVAVDEQGTIRGLITLEDLLEEIVGDIFSEGDSPIEGATRGPDGAYVVPASVQLRDLERDLGIVLPEGETYSTLAGLVLDRCGRIPEIGERVRVDTWELEVVDGNRRRVKSVRVRMVPPER